VSIVPNNKRPLIKGSLLSTKPLGLIKVLGIIMGLFACSTSSIFIPFNARSANFKQTITQDTSPAYPKIKKLAKSLAAQSGSQDGLLFSQESGRLFQLAGSFDASKNVFSEAIERYRKQGRSAHIQLSDTGQQSLSLISNDNVITYDGEPYEQVMVHHFQALNYMFLRDITAAAIELRRAAGMQRRIELDEEKTKQQGITAARKNGISLKSLAQSEQIQQMNQLMANNPQGFQNASTYFLSAVFWEAQRQWNSALVDYKKALTILPHHPDIKAGIVRVTKARDGELLKTNQTGRLVILFEQDFVAERSAFSLSVPSPSSKMILSISLPFYAKSLWPKEQSLSILAKGQSLSTTALTNLSALAAKSLQHEYPVLITRQVLRTTTKKQFQAELNKNPQALG
jgi:hypothetical protein